MTMWTHAFQLFEATTSLQAYLAGGFNPSAKNTRQIGSFPLTRGENNKYFKATT